MPWSWTPLAVPGILSGAAMVALSGMLLAAPPSRRNRALAYLLLSIGVSDGIGAGLAHMTSDPGTALGLQRMCYFAGFLLPGLYLNFLATLDSPLARPLRSGPGSVLIITLLAVPSAILAVAPHLFLAGVQPVPFTNHDVVAGPLATPGLQIIALVGLYGLATTISAYRRAVTPVGRRWTRWILAGFAVRDGATVLVVLSWATWANYPMQTARDLVVFHFIPLADVTMALLMTHGLLHVQVLHRTAWTRRTGGAFVAAIGTAALAAIAASSADHDVAPLPFTVVVAGAGAFAGACVLWSGRRRGKGDLDVRKRHADARQYAYEEAWLMGVPFEGSAPLDGDGHAGPPRKDGAFGHADRFAVLRELGRGSTSRAFLANDHKLGRPVVLKQSTLAWRDAAAREHFRHEARLLARLQHPNVATVHEVLDDVDPPVLVMEYLQGGSLAQELAKGPMRVPRARDVADDLLAGLAALHRAGIVHRDVKPSNILLDADGRVKISDLGIARSGDAERIVLAARASIGPRATGGAAAGADPDATRSEFGGGGGTIGTAGYMSPEAARGLAVGPPSDVYSAAVVLHEAATGAGFLPRRPALSAAETTLLAAAANGLPGPLPAAFAAWEPWFRRALESGAGRRFADAGEALRAFRALVPGAS